MDKYELYKQIIKLPPYEGGIQHLLVLYMVNEQEDLMIRYNKKSFLLNWQNIGYQNVRLKKWSCLLSIVSEID